MKDFLRKNRLRIAITFVVASVGTLIRRSFFEPQLSWDIDLLIYAITFLLLNIIYGFFANINPWLDRYLPFQKHTALRIIIQMLAGMTLILSIRLVGTYLIRENHLIRISSEIQRFIFIADVFMAAAVNLAVISNYLITQWKSSLLRNDMLEKEKALIQYHSLKNMVNPHFLFNSFSTLQGIIRSDAALADQYVGHLARVYRYVLQHSEKTLTPLDSELQFLETYRELLAMRYENALRFDVTIRPEAREMQVVAITLQTLVDNAIKHNEIHPEKPLTIRIYETEQCLYIENNLQPRPSLIESHGEGLHQLQTLYSYLSEKPVESGIVGSSFRVCIPLIEG